MTPTNDAWISLRLGRKDLDLVLQDCRDKGTNKAVWIRDAIQKELARIKHTEKTE